MIKHEPSPIFDAIMYLTNMTNGYTTSKFYETALLRYPNNKDEFIRYFDLLLEVEARLHKSITVDDSTLRLLFCPLSEIKEKLHDTVTQDSVCHMLVPEEENPFKYEGREEFFTYLRKRKERVARTIADAVSADTQRPDYGKAPLDMSELFKMVNESDWPQTSKYTLLDVAMNTDKYIDMLENAIAPVVDEFIKCRPLWEPLAVLFCESYSMFSSARELLIKKYEYTPGNLPCIVVPSITAFRQCFFTSVDENTDEFWGIIGVMYDLLRRISLMKINAESEISRTMSVLGDPSRFNIVLRLVDGPAYGRELAKHLNISPGTVSQHLSILTGSGIVTSTVDGNKVYYSLDMNRVDYFLEMQWKMFHNEGEFSMSSNAGAGAHIKSRAWH